MKKALLLTNHDISILKLGGRVILPLADGEEILLMFDKEKEPRTYMTRKRREVANSEAPQEQRGPKKTYRSEGHRAAYESGTHRGFQTVKCPTCKKPFKRFGLQIHHNKAHGRFLSQKEKEEAQITKANGKSKNMVILSKDQRVRKRQALIDGKDGTWACHACKPKRKGFKNKTAASMHYMSTHVRGWRKSATAAAQITKRKGKEGV